MHFDGVGICDSIDFDCFNGGPGSLHCFLSRLANRDDHAGSRWMTVHRSNHTADADPQLTENDAGLSSHLLFTSNSHHSPWAREKVSLADAVLEARNQISRPDQIPPSQPDR